MCHRSVTLEARKKRKKKQDKRNFHLWTLISIIAWDYHLHVSFWPLFVRFRRVSVALDKSAAFDKTPSFDWPRVAWCDSDYLSRRNKSVPGIIADIQIDMRWGDAWKRKNEDYLTRRVISGISFSIPRNFRINRQFFLWVQYYFIFHIIRQTTIFDVFFLSLNRS